MEKIDLPEDVFDGVRLFVDCTMSVYEFETDCESADHVSGPRVRDYIKDVSMLHTFVSEGYKATLKYEDETIGYMAYEVTVNGYKYIAIVDLDSCVYVDNINNEVGFNCMYKMFKFGLSCQ